MTLDVAGPCEVRCLVVGGDTGAIAVIDDATGHRLPCIDLPARAWIPSAGGVLTDEIARRFGLHTTLLDHLDEGAEGHLCVLEMHGIRSDGPRALTWLTAHDSRRWADDAEGRRVERWCARKASADAHGTAPWQRVGWLDEAEAWIDESLRARGAARIGRVEQVKAGWAGSCVLRVPVAGGTFHFKAGRAEAPSESQIVTRLATAWPTAMPEVVAADHDQGWMLMTSSHGRPLAEATIDDAAEAAGLMGRIALTTVDEIDDWRSIGCRHITVTDTVDVFQRLIEAIDAADGPGRDDGLGELVALLPRVRHLAADVASHRIPDCLVHVDFRSGNVIVGATGPVIFDWSDAMIGHPFFNLQRFLDYMPTPPGAERDVVQLGRSLDRQRTRVCEAFVEPFARFAPVPHLLELAAATRLLNPFFQAVRWSDARHHHPEGSPHRARVDRAWQTAVTHALAVARRLDGNHRS
jgi:aminoglycoside phosphotransferase (APT) family kinase protein